MVNAFSSRNGCFSLSGQTKGVDNTAVFRVEKTGGYIVISNRHLRNPNLTLKAKGLLSQILSLPENWKYALKGLSSINKESTDAIRTAVWILERPGTSHAVRAFRTELFAL